MREWQLEERGPEKKQVEISFLCETLLSVRGNDDDHEDLDRNGEFDEDDGDNGDDDDDDDDDDEEEEEEEEEEQQHCLYMSIKASES